MFKIIKNEMNKLSFNKRKIVKNYYFFHKTFHQSLSVRATEIGDFPGGKVHFISTPEFTDPSTTKKLPCYRVMNEKGKIVNHAVLPEEINEEMALKMYKLMVRQQIMDNIFYDAQRQGRISFYMTATGEEATLIGSAAALSAKDMVFAQYREPGVLMYRGFTLEQFADQCFSNEDDNGKGRQMPVHYGSKELSYQTISSPLATQIPHAAGAAYAYKISGSENIVVCYFGEGAASEGDFHAALNFAATRECPVLFFCRNNGFAISTPAIDQYRGDGIAGRASGYGIPAIRCDGNDILAVYDATKKARQLINNNNYDKNKNKKSYKGPVLIEAMSYRQGHHSTSDDSTRYRPVKEIKDWKEDKCPVNRMKLFLLNNGWWNENRETNLRDDERTYVLEAITKAEGKKKPNLNTMFEDVYFNKPPNLIEQEKEMMDHIKKYPDHYIINDSY